MPTNPFITASGRRQQILVSKEQTFVRKNAHANGETSTNRRPIKLPLRKHHSFHFQPSQTVAGVLKHDHIQQNHHSNQSTKDRYKNQGPLVFKPFNEKSAFKPIVPSPKESNDSEGESNGRHDFDPLTMPRICGTSLKRHISNVETFSSNKWQSDNEENCQNPITTASTANRRKIHYADLAPFPAANVNSNQRRNDRNNNSNSNDDTDNADGSSSSEHQTASDASAKEDQKPINNSSNVSSSNVTQYATLRFDEISI